MKKQHNILMIVFILNISVSMAEIDWEELSNEQQKILLPFQPSWNSLDDEAKEKLMVNTNKWLDMSPVQRNQSKQKLNRFRNLPKEERERLKQRFEHLKNLTPQERRQLEQAKRKFQYLSSEDKARLRKKYNHLPPAQRKKAIQRFNRKQGQKEFISKFDIEKRQPIVEMFKNLEKPDRMKLRKYMKKLSPKQRHEQILELLSMQVEKRSTYIQSL